MIRFMERTMQFGDDHVAVIAAYLCPADFRYGRPAICFGKTKFKILLEQVDKMAEYLATEPKTKADIKDYTFSWPWSKHKIESLERWQVRLVHEHRDEIMQLVEGR